MTSKRFSDQHKDAFVFWPPRRRRGLINPGCVVIAHPDRPVAESMALLVRLKGYAAIGCAEIEDLKLMLDYWKPGSLLIDIRLCLDDDFRFIRQAVSDGAFANTLLVALTGMWPAKSPQALKEIGFDGFCYRPCPIWRLADLFCDNLLGSLN